MYELQSVSLLSLSPVVHHKVKGVTIFELKLCGVKLPLFTLDGPNISEAEAIHYKPICPASKSLDGPGQINIFSVS